MGVTRTAAQLNSLSSLAYQEETNLQDKNTINSRSVNKKEEIRAEMEKVVCWVVLDEFDVSVVIIIRWLFPASLIDSYFWLPILLAPSSKDTNKMPL